MKAKILAVLAKRPGLRIRSIASYIDTSNLIVSQTLYEMLDEGLVTKIYIHRPESLEFYNLWFKS